QFAGLFDGTGNSVIKKPGVIVRFIGQIALALDKTAQIPSLDFLTNISERADAVEERILRMGNIRDFIFLIGRFYQPLWHTVFFWIYNSTAKRHRSHYRSFCAFFLPGDILP